VLAGVCSGLAVASGVSVTWVRIAFVIAGFSGIGIVAYLALALALPGEDPRLGPRLAPAPRDTARWLRVALVAGPILGLTGLFGRTWRGPFLFGWFGGGAGFGVLLVAVGLFVIWLRRREDDDRPVAAATESPAAEAVTPTRWSSPSAAEAAVRPAGRSRSGTLVAARIVAWLAVIGSAVVLAAAVGLERIGALSIPMPVLVFGSALLALGAIIAATIWVRTALPIVASLALLLVPVVLGVSMASWNGGVGDRRVVPAALQDGANDYRLAIGQLTLDLSQAPLDGRDVDVSAATKIGELAVVVPSAVTVTLDTHVGAGQSTIFGHDRSGLNVTEHLTDTPAGATGRLHLDLDVAVGQLTVCRVPAVGQLPVHRCGPVLARR
jgi:phage shock protein PspC (stress-responsive transcriptional regulator)